MKFPNKVTPYKDSILPKLPIILKYLKNQDYTVMNLFDKVRERMTIKEYIDALDCLYAINEITLTEEVLHYVKRNLL